MSILVASLTFSVLWVYWSWACATFLRADPPAWTRHDLPAIACVMVVVCLLPVALGGVIDVALEPERALADLTAATGLAAAAAPIGAWAMRRAIRMLLRPAGRPEAP